MSDIAQLFNEDSRLYNEFKENLKKITNKYDYKYNKNILKLTVILFAGFLFLTIATSSPWYFSFLPYILIIYMYLKYITIYSCFDEVIQSIGKLNDKLFCFYAVLLLEKIFEETPIKDISVKYKRNSPPIIVFAGDGVNFVEFSLDDFYVDDISQARQHILDLYNEKLENE